MVYHKVDPGKAIFVFVNTKGSDVSFAFFTTTLAVMLPLSLFSYLQYQKSGHVPPTPPLSLLLPALLGGAVGALLLSHLQVKLLQRIFATVVLFSGILMVI